MALSESHTWPFFLKWERQPLPSVGLSFMFILGRKKSKKLLFSIIPPKQDVILRLLERKDVWLGGREGHKDFNLCTKRLLIGFSAECIKTKKLNTFQSLITNPC